MDVLKILYVLFICLAMCGASFFKYHSLSVKHQMLLNYEEDGTYKELWIQQKLDHLQPDGAMWDQVLLNQICIFYQLQ